MFYRRKILLAFFDAFGSRIDKIRLQKLLFLFCQEQKKPAFHFMPYIYGCFSFQAYADLLTLKKAGIVDDNGNEWLIKQENDGTVALSDDDECLLRDIQRRFSFMDKKHLIRYTYLNFPFFAINSTILKQNLNASEIATIRSAIARDTTATLFTIGYEGKSLEEFINALLRNNVSLLCDVRKNAFSMKYGFSKSTLIKACEKVKVTYLHIPELGIESSQRKSLETKEDYKTLFDRYRKTVLTVTSAIQKEVFLRIEKAGRAALMCFEADPSMCHRSHLADALLSINNANLPLVNL
jgi:uncharacterized protein (DUF488 family)